MKENAVFRTLKEKIVSHKATIGVIGMGYVGLPLALEFVKAGFKTIGVDVDTKKIALLKKNTSYITDILDEELVAAQKTRRFHAASETRFLKDAEVIIICVPTPLRKTKEPDISYIVAAGEEIKKIGAKGRLIVLESTTYPGTTEELLVPLLMGKDARHKKDCYVLFSPERIDPGNAHYKTASIPKVVGGVDQESTELGRLLYSQIIASVLPVSSSRAAEMVKMYENTFRSVNIGLANELALVCDTLGINVWEVIEAASSKPFGFMPFYPGPGIGGHCIPLDPHYLSWKAKLHGFEPRFIDLASQINAAMPKYVVSRLMEILNRHKKSLFGSTILVMGITYKKDVSDMRESPALEVLHLLKERGVRIQFHDPYVKSCELQGSIMHSVPCTREVLKKTDCVVIVTDHTEVDYGFIVTHASLIFDTRNALKNYKASGKVIKL